MTHETTAYSQFAHLYNMLVLGLRWHCWVLGEIWLGGVIWGHIWVHPAKGLTVTGPLGRVDSEKGGFQSPIRSS